MEDTIHIQKLNESYIKIICSDSIRNELAEYFCFDVPGAEFQPKFRSRHWDGKIRLFNKQTKRLPLGLISNLMVFCEDRSYLVTWDNSAKDLDTEDEFSVYHAQKFIDSLNIHSNGVKLTIHEHQIKAFRHVMQARRTLIKSPTASGKSLIMYLLFRQLHQYQGLKGLLVVPNTSLVEQMYSDFQDYSSENVFDVEKEVHRVYEGHEKESSKSLIISTWQSIYNMPEMYFKQFDYIMGDEAHLWKADSLGKIISHCVNAKYRVALTGSFDGWKVNKLTIEGHFGPARTVATSRELMDKGLLTKIDIKCLLLKHGDENREKMHKATYQDELDYLISSEQRNKFIKNLAISMDKNTMVLFQMVERHGHILYDMIKNSENIGERKVYYVHGGVDTDDREVIRKIMETETNAIVIASYGTFSTGINIKNLHNIIFASPTKSMVRVLQSIGRGLRLFLDKDVATLYDIADDLRYGTHVNHTLKHFAIRLQIYGNEKFPFKIYNIRMK